MEGFNKMNIRIGSGKYTDEEHTTSWHFTCEIVIKFNSSVTNCK